MSLVSVLPCAERTCQVCGWQQLMSPSSVLGLLREIPQCGQRGGVGAVTPGGRGGGARLASHTCPNDCPHHLGSECPVPSVWHYCPALQPWQARGQILPACSTTSGPAVCCLLLSQRGLQRDLPSPHDESLKATERKTVSVQTSPAA